MRLRVLLPTQVIVNEQVSKVSFAAEDGARTMLPRHIDFVSSLHRSVLAFVHIDGEEEFVGVDTAILVKAGSDVTVVTPNAVRGHQLGELERTIAEQFERRQERERAARSALARIETDIVRRFAELGEGGIE